MTRSHRLNRLFAAATATAALAAPTAIARPLDSQSNVPYPNERPVVVQPVDAGFDWDSAAIGAGGVAAVVALVSLGGFGYVSRHRMHPTV
jgi:hypothetical protein